MNKKQQKLICLQYTYNTRNSQEIMEELIKLPINEHMKIITLDIKDMYVNLSITGIIQSTKFWLNKHNNNKELIEQALHMLNNISKQNYFHYDDQPHEPKKGIAMGSPISSTTAEVYLQHLEETHIKQWSDCKEIIYYKRHVNDILIIYDQSTTNEKIIIHQVNNIDKNRQFKISTEDKNTINYLDSSIYRNNKSMDMSTYRKPTKTGTIIHFTSNHPYEQKMAAFNYYINKLLTMPITEQSKQVEWKTIIATAKNNSYPINMINNLKKN
jgi:hypothetical protein